MPAGPQESEFARAIAASTLTLGMSTGAITDNPPEPPKVKLDQGIPFRQAVEGHVYACVNLGDAATQSEAQNDVCGNPTSKGQKVVLHRIDRLLQLGPVYYLPCTGGAFSSVTCSYTTDDAGRLKTIGTASTAAVAEALAKSAGDIAKQAADAAETIRDSKTKNLEAQTAYLKAQAENRAAEAALADADPPNPDAVATAALTARAKHLDAERALLEAEAALRAARGKATPSR